MHEDFFAFMAISNEYSSCSQTSNNCNTTRSGVGYASITSITHSRLGCNVVCGSGIVTVNSPSGSTLQCNTWLWDDMPLNSPKRPPYWNSTSGFHFHTSPQSTCHSVPCSLRNFIQIGPPSAEKNDVMSIFKMADLSHPPWIVGIQ